MADMSLHPQSVLDGLGMGLEMVSNYHLIVVLVIHLRFALDELTAVLEVLVVYPVTCTRAWIRVVLSLGFGNNESP